MKTVILALFVLLAVSQSEGLRCNCGGLKQCSSPVETCYGSNNVCASVIIYAGSRPSYFKGCMTSNECMRMNHPGISSASCCRTDQCNR
uniref:Uncharacterized protein n=1 Tax=Dicentrarchus labrax TaxID=13489 RepID=A0A8C4F757_DICLA